LLFAAEDFDAPLAGSIPEVARATDRIAENYIESLDSSSVATAVRQMLVQMLPSGRTDQDTVANRLYRSRSTLQRQLSAEGTSYRDILETTRQALAEQYLLDGEYSQAQIAFMVGFADQSNFARAFKRWTGKSPGEYQKAA
jgi:AraC-like DNA-binding protein